MTQKTKGSQIKYMLDFIKDFIELLTIIIRSIFHVHRKHKEKKQESANNGSRSDKDAEKAVETPRRRRRASITQTTTTTTTTEFVVSGDSSGGSPTIPDSTKSQAIQTKKWFDRVSVRNPYKNEV